MKLVLSILSPVLLIDVVLDTSLMFYTLITETKVPYEGQRDMGSSSCSSILLASDSNQ